MPGDARMPLVKGGFFDLAGEIIPRGGKGNHPYMWVLVLTNICEAGGLSLCSHLEITPGNFPN